MVEVSCQGQVDHQSKHAFRELMVSQLSLSAGAPFELFGGNVIGKVQEVEAPKKLVQAWQARSPSWPSGE